MTLRRVMMGLAALLSLGTPLSGRAEEGFWTFDHFPSETVRERYASAPDQAWLDHVRSGAVRLGAGSASLASSEGLVLTNEHVIEDCVKDVSGAGSDLLRDRLPRGTAERREALPRPAGGNPAID